MKRIIIYSFLIIFYSSESQAQIINKWVGVCGELIHFENEPPTGSLIKGFKDYHGNHISVINNEFSFFVKRQYRSFDDSFSIVIKRENKGDSLLIKRIDINSEKVSYPVVLKKQQTLNTYYIFLSSLRTEKSKTHQVLEVIEYDAERNKLALHDTLFYKIPKYTTKLNGNIKGVEYVDGSQYILYMSKTADSSVYLFKVAHDIELVLKHNYDVLNSGKYYFGEHNACDFFHNQKGFVYDMKNGIAKLLFNDQGIISDEIIWLRPESSANSGISMLELSPNDSFAYIGYHDFTWPRESNLVQFDLHDNSFIRIGDVPYHSCSLAPNGKLYTGFKSRVSQPNLKAERCAYEEKLDNYEDCNAGLINSTRSNIEPYAFVWFKAINTCGDSLRLYNLSDSIFKVFEWHLEYTNRGTDTIINSKHKRIAVNDGEKLFVKLKGITESGRFQWFSDTVIVKKYSSPRLNTSLPDSVCQYADAVLQLNFNSDSVSTVHGESIKWVVNGGGYNQKELNTFKYYLHPIATGIITVKLNYSNGFCESDTVFTIRVKPAIKPNFSLSDTIGCTPLKIR